MGSKRRNNPYRTDAEADLGGAWNSGYIAAQYNKILDNAEAEVQHPDCDYCVHNKKERYNLKVMFVLEQPVNGIEEHIDASILVEQLADALPKEWWVGANVAEWGTVAIHPLNDDGMVVGGT